MKKKFAALFLCIALLTPTFAVNATARETGPTASEPEYVETQVYYPTEDEDYVPNKIIVILREEYSGLNKFYDASDFPQIPVVEYEALTELSEEDANDPNSGRYYHYQQYILLTYDGAAGLSMEEAMDRLALNPMVEQIYADTIYAT